MKNAITSALLLAFMLLAGCSAPKVPKIFYPPAPDAPRLQFLTSIHSEYDLKSGGFTREVYRQAGNYGLELKRARAAAFYGDSLYVADIGVEGLVRFNFKTQKASLLKDANPSIGKPMDIAIDAEGNKYVSDIKGHQIVVIDRENRVSRFIREPMGMNPIGVDVDATRIFVSDTDASQVNIYDKASGKLLKTMGKDEGMAWPASTAVDPKGNLAILNMGSFQLLKYTPEGKKIMEFGQVGDQLGNMSRPKSVAIDKSGYTYILDAAFENVQLFNPAGHLLMFFAHGGPNAEDLLLPSTLNLSYAMAPYVQRFAAPGFKVEYVVMVSSQYGPSKINLYGFGRKEGADYSKYSDQLPPTKPSP